MDRTRTTTRRIALALLTLLVALTSSGLAQAGPEPEDPTGDLPATVLALLTQPTNVVATGIDPTTIHVSWQDTGLLESGFRVEISTDQNGPWTTAGTSPTCNPDPQRGTGTTPSCVLLITAAPASDPTPRWVRVVPFIKVADIEILPGTPSLPDPAILAPTPPTGLKCNGGIPGLCTNVMDIELTWNDNSDEAVFWIMRAPNSPQASCANKPFGSTPYAIIPANTTTFEDHLTVFSATYFYKVVAVREVNIVKQTPTGPIIVVERSFANGVSPACVKVDTAPVDPPTNPSGLTAVFIPPTTVELSWSDNQPDPGDDYIEEDGWFIEFGPTSPTPTADYSQWHQVTARTFPGNGTVTFLDNRPADTNRCYVVRAWRAGPAYSSPTNPVCVGPIPKAPSNLTAVAVSNARVNLAWKDNSTTEEGFVVERCAGVCTSLSNWADFPPVTVAPDSTTYADQTTVATTTYSYRVRAKNSVGQSSPTNIATVTTPIAPVAAPINLIAIPLDAHSNKLDWTDVSLDETGFRIEYRDSIYEDFATLVSLPAGTDEYIDEESLSANQTRCYQVRAVKGTKVSDPSNIACPTTLGTQPPNGAPTGLTAFLPSGANELLANTRIDLRWTDHATNETSFRVDILQATNADCSDPNPTAINANVAGSDDVGDENFKLHQSAPKYTGSVPGTVNHTINGLVPHSVYFFRVRAVNRDGVSGRPRTTACIRTAGPKLPVWKDPSESGDVKATRCDFTLTMATTGDDRVAKARIYVNAYISGQIASTDTINLESATPAPGAGYTVTGNDWVVKYKFIKGPIYRLTATSFGVAPNYYTSANAGVSDIKVLADCPIDPDPYNPEPIPSPIPSPTP